MAPLLKPEDCCILFIDPTRRNAEDADSDDGGLDALISRHTLVQQAARVLEVPKFFAVYGEKIDEREWIVRPSDQANPRIHAVGMNGSVWSSSGLGGHLQTKAGPVLCSAAFGLSGVLPLLPSTPSLMASTYSRSWTRAQAVTRMRNMQPSTVCYRRESSH